MFQLLYDLKMEIHKQKKQSNNELKIMINNLFAVICVVRRLINFAWDKSLVLSFSLFLFLPLPLSLVWQADKLTMYKVKTSEHHHYLHYTHIFIVSFAANIAYSVLNVYII